MSKIIYCDGSSLGNPGPAGFAVIALDTEKKLIWEYGGREDRATNNKMELAGCLYALQLILKSKNTAEIDKKQVTYELRLDSKYAIQGATEWMPKWIQNKWKNSEKKDVANKEIWQEILKCLQGIEAKNIKLVWTHVYGHTGEIWNERCDEIAKAFAGNKDIKLKKSVSY